MKLNGITGKGTGKLGSSVFANVAGEQIVRQYNGSVSNPNTKAQVGQRAKFKLASQLAAAMSSEIAIPKKGMTSARNLFVKKNIGSITMSENTASVEYEKIQLTAGTIALPAVEGVLGGGDLGVNMASDVSSIVDRVCYVVFKISEQNVLEFVDSKIVNTPGNAGTFSSTFEIENGDYVLYAYGIKDKSGAASVKYENYQISKTSEIATLVATNSLSTADYTFTKTVGTTVSGME